MTATAVAAGAAVAVATASGSAGAAPPPVTLGSTDGTPTGNICSNCTLFSNSSGTTPALQVPSDGTITSFSIHSNSSMGALVQLRVLRPTGSGAFTGAGTSPAETLTSGVDTFSGLSLPVHAGDVLGIDNISGAIVVDANATAATTFEYLPALADGSTGTPNGNPLSEELLLSAVEQPNGTTTTTPPTTPPTTSTTPTTPSGPITSTNPNSVPTPPSGTKPSLSSVSQSHRAWRRGGELATIAAKGRPKKGPPTGTRFQFTLNQPAKVTLAFKHKVKVRTKTGKTSFVMKTVGQLSFVGHSGVNKVLFQGRLTRTQRLSPGPYTVVFGASTSAGSAQSVSRNFTILH